MRLASFLLVLSLPGCWLSHRAAGSDGGTDDTPSLPACASCDCAETEVCVMGSCRPPRMTTTWARQFHSPSGSATGASFDGSGALAVGGYVFRSADLGLGPVDAGARGDGVVAVFEADGSTRWARTFPGDAAQVTHVAFASGSVWTAGVFGRNATVLDQDLRSARSPDAFVAHLGARGEPLAVLQFASEEDDRVLSLLPSGREARIAGYYRGPATLGTSTLESGTGAFVATTSGSGIRSLSRVAELGTDLVNDAATTSREDMVVAGFYTRSGPALPPRRGSGDGYVARLDASGSVVWAVGIGGAGEDNARNVEADAAGNVYVVAGIGDGFALSDFTLEGEGTVLLSLGPDGDFRWARTLNGSARPGSQLTLDAAGNPIVLVSFEGSTTAEGFDTLPSHGGTDILIATYDRNGEPLEARVLGGDGNEWPGGIATDGCGGFAIVGAFSGTLSTDAGTLVSKGTDGFVTRWVQ